MITLCITNWNRYELLKESFSQVIGDARIKSVIIVDDCSDMQIFLKVRDLQFTNPKIKVYRTIQNQGMSMSKFQAIAWAPTDYCVIFDSDNILKSDYLDSIPKELDPDTIYLPSFAWPNFDYRKFEGFVIDATNVSNFIKDDKGNMCLNTCNYLVHSKTYQEVYQNNPEMKATDTLWFAYLWLQAGKRFMVVPGMTYFHRVHPQSGFLQDAKYNMDMGGKLRKQIMSL